MKKILNYKVNTIVCVILMVASIAVTSVVCISLNAGTPTTEPVTTEQVLTNDELYSNAVKDAMIVEEDEIIPLVVIDESSEMITYNESGDKVLLVTWHKYPDSYVSGSEYNLQYGEVWSFSEKEIKQWYKQNSSNVSDWTLRLEQLVGVPANNGKTHFSAMWVNPDDILRPAYSTDIDNSEMEIKFSEDADAEFITWFNGNIIWSYFDSAYPWTRLGYTYDWADNGVEYGLTEFIIKKDSVVDIEYTYTIDEFLHMLAS